MTYQNRLYMAGFFNAPDPVAAEKPKPMPLTEAKRFVVDAIKDIGIGYHPDTHFENYIDGEGLPLYTPEDAAELWSTALKVFDAFDDAGEDIYEFGCEQFREQFADAFGPMEVA